MRKIAIALACAMLASIWVETVYANDIPPGCQSAYAKRRYEMSLRSGENLAKQAWSKISAQNGCLELENFTDIVVGNVERLTLYPRASAAVICTYTGTVDGIYNQLDKIWDTCQTDCAEEGRLTGEFAAQVYCDLSIALNGLENADEFMRGPVQICGLEFENACDAEFIYWSLGYPDPYDMTIPVEDRACLLYTEDKFEDVWNQTRINQCAFNPIDPMLPIAKTKLPIPVKTYNETAEK